MPAPKGNQFWKVRTKQSRDKLFTDPETLWEAACEYFEWATNNPLFEHKATQYQGVPVDMHIEKPRVFTIEGLTLFLGIDRKTYSNYRQKDGYEDFFPIMDAIEATIRNQKYAGAAADIFNANIIARDLGLSDKTETQLSGPEGGPVVISDDPIEAAKAYQAMMEGK